MAHLITPAPQGFMFFPLQRELPHFGAPRASALAPACRHDLAPKVGAMHKSLLKPRKPRRDFPLTAHNNGQWVKWIKPRGGPALGGQVICFGPWHDPAGAEALYDREKADWFAGRNPRVE